MAQMREAVSLAANSVQMLQPLQPTGPNPSPAFSECFPPHHTRFRKGARAGRFGVPSSPLCSSLLGPPSFLPPPLACQNGFLTFLEVWGLTGRLLGSPGTG